MMNRNSKFDPKVNSVTFDKYMLAVRRIIPDDLVERHSDHVMRQASIEELPERIYGGLVYEMRSWLLKSQHSEKRYVYTRVPLTWWDHLKVDFAESHSPVRRWLASKLAPPRYRTESTEVETTIRVCPHNDYYLSEKSKAHFAFLTWKDDPDETGRSATV